jgi:transposase-like protein
MVSRLWYPLPEETAICWCTQYMATRTAIVDLEIVLNQCLEEIAKTEAPARPLRRCLRGPGAAFSTKCPIAAHRNLDRRGDDMTKATNRKTRKTTRVYAPHEIRSMTELPPLNTRRWVARRKAAVVAAVFSGMITLEEACRRYQMSEEEFFAWRAFENYGFPGCALAAFSSSATLVPPDRRIRHPAKSRQHPARISLQRSKLLAALLNGTCKT